MNPKSVGQSGLTETDPIPDTVVEITASTHAGQPDAAQGKPENRPGYCALIVDDDSSSQKLLGLSLSMQPQITDIDYAYSGAEAIKKAKVKNYDFIFLDALMEGMDGYETCAILREIPEYKHTAIIMVTGLTSPMDQARGILAGTSTYVTKPVQQLAFKRMVTRELELLRYRRSLK